MHRVAGFASPEALYGTSKYGWRQINMKTSKRTSASRQSFDDFKKVICCREISVLQDIHKEKDLQIYMLKQTTSIIIRPNLPYIQFTGIRCFSSDVLVAYLIAATSERTLT